MFHVKHRSAGSPERPLPRLPDPAGPAGPPKRSTFSSITNEASPTTRVSTSTSPRPASVLRRPARRIAARRLAHAQPAPDRHERDSRTPRSPPGGPNPRATTSGNGSRAPGPGRPPRPGPSITVDPIAQPEPVRPLPRSTSPTGCRESSRVATAPRPLEQEGQPGHAAAAAQIQERAGGGRALRPRRGCGRGAPRADPARAAPGPAHPGAARAAAAARSIVRPGGSPRTGAAPRPPSWSRHRRSRRPCRGRPCGRASASARAPAPRRSRAPFDQPAGEAGERLPALGPVAGDVHVDPGAVAAGLPLDDRPHQLLDRVEGCALRADEQPEVRAVDLDGDGAVVDLVGDVGVRRRTPPPARR